MRPWMLLAGLVLAMGPELVPEADAARASSREVRGATARAPSASATPARSRAAPAARAARSAAARRTPEARRPAASRAAPRAAPRAAQRPAPPRSAALREAVAPRPTQATIIPVALKLPVEAPRAPPGSAATCNLSFPCTDDGGRYYVGFDREKIYLSPRPDPVPGTTRSAGLNLAR
ncbi:hypothetical protein [Sabulicella glaciei]|uniref:Uncharacterized protein n=1 Tax=Sabulicella glaciei TaxID=2984948 RepID=A0ABT3NY61_9PROT|nr:hypothetical protein [Roseococcus sp. MDT2-1-1]MCW8087102.1 hypothetical protein [Roseococcus sp. MDT2-1-1]